jgi:hypothetical protein
MDAVIGVLLAESTAERSYRCIHALNTDKRRKVMSWKPQPGNDVAQTSTMEVEGYTRPRFRSVECGDDAITHATHAQSPAPQLQHRGPKQDLTMTHFRCDTSITIQMCNPCPVVHLRACNPY